MQDMQYRIDRSNQRSVVFVTPRYAYPVQEDEYDRVWGGWILSLSIDLGFS